MGKPAIDSHVNHRLKKSISALKRMRTISSLPRAFLHGNFSKTREVTEAKHMQCQDFTRHLGRRLYTPGLNKVTLDLRLGLEKSGPGPGMEHCGGWSSETELKTFLANHSYRHDVMLQCSRGNASRAYLSIALMNSNATVNFGGAGNWMSQFDQMHQSPQKQSRGEMIRTVEYQGAENDMSLILGGVQVI